MAGLTAILYSGYFYWTGWYSQRMGERELQELTEYSRRLKPTAPAVEPSKPRIGEGELVGRIEVPRIGLSAIVFEGTGDGTLEKGVGHVTGTSMPGADGNVALAAHRDTFFRPLERIAVGDEIRVTTPSASDTYVVRSTTIVKPTDTDVLKPQGEPRLTLITCYPFHFIGHAPKRYIVQASRIGTTLASVR